MSNRYSRDESLGCNYVEKANLNGIKKAGAVKRLLAECRKTYSAPSDEGAAECGYDRDWMAKSAGER